MNHIDPQTPSTRPYLIRALHEWCADHGLTPYIAVHVDRSVQVPPEFVKGAEIVLNVSFDATSGLRLGNEFIEFTARFGGVPRDIAVPVTHVLAIYARENGQGMAFPPPPKDLVSPDPAPGKALASVPEGLRPVPPGSAQDGGPSPLDVPPGGSGGAGRPHLKRIK